MPTYKNKATGKIVKRTKPSKRLEASARFATVQSEAADQGSDSIGQDSADAKGGAQAGKRGS